MRNFTICVSALVKRYPGHVYLPLVSGSIHTMPPAINAIIPNTVNANGPESWAPWRYKQWLTISSQTLQSMKTT